MSRPRRGLLGLTLLLSALAFFDSGAQAPRSASPPEIIELDQAVVEDHKEGEVEILISSSAREASHANPQTP